jgi:hypothetical protein
MVSWFRRKLDCSQIIQPQQKRKIENMTTLHSRKSINPSPLRRGFRFGALALILACFALPPASRALLPPPPPDGGYPGGNTAEGAGALFSLTTGEQNTAVGFNALRNNSGAFSDANTAIGYQALFANTGLGNTACGRQALFTNTTGRSNTAIGISALQMNTIGDGNTATGDSALFNNRTGNENTATGAFALNSSFDLTGQSTGQDNTATGAFALFSNITGSGNTANGILALSANTSGFNNTAIGVRALQSATTANGNTATGAGALLNDNTGANNTANGQNALFRNTIGANNTANGFSALFNNTMGARNIALSFNAGVNLTTGSSNIDIGNPGVAAESATIRIGGQGTQTRTFVAGISGSAIAGTSVVVNPAGRLGTVASSQRFKDDVKPMNKASEAILALKPVTFSYKKEIYPTGTTQFGLVAEEVEKVNRDLVVRDKEGKPYSVRYDQVNAMLLNEFLKEHSTVQELKEPSCGAHCDCERAGSVNSKSKRTGRTEQSGTANGSEQSLKLLSASRRKSAGSQYQTSGFSRDHP